MKLSLLKSFCLIIFSLALFSCLQQGYHGPSRGSENIATLIIEKGQADNIELTVNGEKIDGPPKRLSSLPGETSIQLKYYVKSKDGLTRRVGECNLNFKAVKSQLYELRLGLLDTGSASQISEATLNVSLFNTWPTSIYGKYDDHASSNCKDIGVEH